MLENDFTCDLIIIGGGPAGCTAALYAARAGLRTTMSSPSELSGQMAAVHLVENYPSQPPRPGRDVLAEIRRQALEAGAEHVLETVDGVDFSQEGRLIVHGGAREHVAHAVIVATGAMARAAKVPGEEEFQGRGVAYCAACDGPFYKGEKVLVVGDDVEAAEEALSLAAIADSVTLVGTIPEPRWQEEMGEAVQAADNLQVETGLKLQEITGEGAVQGAIFKSGDGEMVTVPAAGAFLYLRGHAPAIEFLGGVLETDERGFLIADELRQISHPAVFAAGDVRQKPMRQMVIAAADGCIAALGAERYIRKRPAIKSDYSGH